VSVILAVQIFFYRFENCTAVQATLLKRARFNHLSILAEYDPIMEQQ